MLFLTHPPRNQSRGVAYPPSPNLTTFYLHVVSFYRKMVEYDEFERLAHSLDTEKQFRFRHSPQRSRGRYNQNSGRQIGIGGFPYGQRQKSLLPIKRLATRRTHPGHFPLNRSDEGPNRFFAPTKYSSGASRFHNRLR